MRSRLPTFWIRVGLIAALIALADWLLFEVDGLGLNVALVLMSWVAGLAVANPAILRDRRGRGALVTAGAFALLQFERPTFVGFLLFAVAFGVAALSPRAPAGDDAWRWSQRLLAAALKAFWGPFRDLATLRKTSARRRTMRAATILLGAVLPVVGGLVFLSLFAIANPVIADMLGNLSLPAFEPGRLVFWGLIGLAVSAAIRARGLRRTMAIPAAEGDLELPGVSTGSIIASLVVFNGLFAIENGLDIGYLWADARLPGNLTFAQYAHSGAHPLIVTALLAGLFVLIFLRPGSKTAASPVVRALVTLWIVQNVFLVASAALRTLDYVEAYSLTVMRIAALIWMAMVAVGLALIMWRLLASRSAGWLINGNALVAGVVLAVCSVVDLGAIAASWNVRNAREVGGAGVELDLCYLGRLRGAGVVALAELEKRPLPAELRDRVAWKRAEVVGHMAGDNGRWRSWRWRDDRRLARVRDLTGADASATLAREGRDCNGRLPPPRPVTAPLTPAAKPGT